MGWDAYADRKKIHLSKFKSAAKRVAKEAGSVDGLLEGGGLDCSACADALQEATGANCWDENGWNADKVKRLAKDAFWPIDMDVDKKWAVLSAKEFLNTCAKLGIGIRFSW